MFLLAAAPVPATAAENLLDMAALPATAAATKNLTIATPTVCYFTDYDGRMHHLGLLADSTSVTMPQGTFRVSTRLLLEYRCHQRDISHRGIPLEAGAAFMRLPVDLRADVSVESPGNFMVDFLGLEPPPFIRANAMVRLTDSESGTYAETAASLNRAAQGFQQDTFYEVGFNPDVVAPARFLRAFEAGHAIEIRLEADAENFVLDAVFEPSPEAIFVMRLLQARCPPADG